MNTKKIIEALNVTIKGLSVIRDELEKDVTIPSNTVEKTVEKAVEVAEETTAVGKIDEKTLKSMKYNDFKKYASQLGVKCTGTRDEIMARILSLDTTKVAEETTEEVEEVEETAVEEEVDSTDEFDAMAEEIAKDTPIGDIIEALKDVDIKATKKDAVEKLASALRKGLIETGDDEDEESVEDEDDEEDLPFGDDDVEESEDSEEEEDDDNEEDEDEDELDENTYTSKYDPKGYNDPDNMSSERAEAISTKMADILEAIEKEDLTEDDINSFLETMVSESDLELLGEDYEDEDLIRFYMEMIKRTIDNDGEEHEPSDPYELGKYDMCCGHELKYSKRTNKYICEICGQEYEADEE